MPAIASLMHANGASLQDRPIDEEIGTKAHTCLLGRALIRQHIKGRPTMSQGRPCARNVVTMLAYRKVSLPSKFPWIGPKP